MTDPDRLIDILFAIDPMSDLPRTGWVLRGVRPCESIADHSYGVAVVTMFLVDAVRAEGETVDGERALRMALLHDAAEARTGDVPMPQKTAGMEHALHELEEGIVRGIFPDEHAELWKEVERGDSLEARIVKASDKIQMMVKVSVYERQRRGHLEEFWRNPRNFDDRGLAPARAVFEAIARRADRVVPRG